MGARLMHWHPPVAKPWATMILTIVETLQWCHNERDCISNQRRLNCLLSHLFRHRSRKTSKLCVTGLCEGNSPVTGEFPAQMTSNEENVSIWWSHHENSSLSSSKIFSSASAISILRNYRKYKDIVETFSKITSAQGLESLISDQYM